MISLREGRIRGVNLHEPAQKVHVDLTIDEAKVDDFDALYIPGGFINPDLLRQSKKVRKFVGDFERTQKPIATICHSAWVLASSGVLKGRTLTSWPGIRDDIVNAGGIWIDEPVVTDGNWISTRGPKDLAAFVPELTKHFRGAGTRKESPSEVQSRKPSPQRNEPPALMLQTMKWMPRPSFRGFAIGVLAVYAMLKRMNKLQTS